MARIEKGARVVWNTGADDATGTVVHVPPLGDVQVHRDQGQHNGGVIYWVHLHMLWQITDPPYQRHAGNA